MSTSNYLPFGFRYPDGFSYSESDPDPKIEAIRKRMEYLNEVHAASGLRGEVFTAAMAKFQQMSKDSISHFWETVAAKLSVQEVADIAAQLSGPFQNELPRLTFPNAIALVDCRFVSNEEWEYLRRYSIGGSEVAAILGLSHFASPRSIYQEKVNYRRHERDASARHILDYGHAVEDYIREQTASIMGVTIWPEHRMFAHKDYPFLTCNPDGIMRFADGHFVLFEAKTAFWKKREDWSQEIPAYYVPQPRHYLEVLDADFLNSGYIAVCFGGAASDLRGFAYERDREAGKAQIQAVMDFWNKYIVTHEPPPLSGDPALDLPACYDYAEHTDAGIFAAMPDHTEAEFDRYFHLKADKKEADQKLRALENEENSLLNQIRAYVPEGYTITEQEHETPYIIKVSDATTERVMPGEFRSKDAYNVLELMAANLKGKSSEWTMPQVSGTLRSF